MACEIEHLFAESLDAVDVGILRLNADLKVRFANRRFIEIWAVPEGLMQGELVADFQSLIRRNDVLGRLGGEEFAVLLPDTSFEAPSGVAERLRARVAEASLTYLDQQIAMTISAGLAMRQPNDQCVEQMIARADDALYRAKQSGRNRVVTEAASAVAA
jgi:PAS domain-containing protein